MPTSPRSPIRLLKIADINSAYPRELLANFLTGDLTLVNEDGTSSLEIPSKLSLTSSGSGNAITGVSVSGHTITITKGSTFLTAHPAITMATDTTSAVSPAHGGTFTAIDGITKDSNGHVTKINVKTVTLPAAPTSISGNAGTATKLETARNIAVAGDITGSADFDGSANISITATLAASGATAGSYGPTANASVGFGGGFAVPQVTVDTKGRVTSAAARTITLPAAPTAASLGAASTKLYTASIGTAWSGTAAPFTQNVAVSGILAADTPIVDMNLASVTYANKAGVTDAYSKIYRITTYANGITVYADEKTTVAIPIQLKVVR